MDVLTDVLRTLRMRGSLLFRCEQHAPWGLATEPTGFATFHSIVTGRCWLRMVESQILVPLCSGDIILLPQGAAHTLSDAPDTPTVPFFGPGTSSHGDTSHSGPGLVTTFVCGLFQLEQQHHPLLALLPPLIHIPGEENRPASELAAVLHVLEEESRRPRMGREVILQRLTDTLFVQIIRAWMGRQASHSAGWIGAIADAQIGPALELIHITPAQNWTIPALAAAVGMSRSAFSARFTTLVGQAPLRYIKQWRMQLAAGLLHGDDALQAIALQVGYDSDAAFSKAFKQAFGIAPGVYRRRARSEQSRREDS